MATKKQGINAYKAAMNQGKKTEAEKAEKPVPGASAVLSSGATKPSAGRGPGKPAPAGDGFVKSVKKETSGYRKAAGLLLLVGKERSAEILQHFSPEEIEKIVHEIALMQDLGPDESSAILSEFHEIRRADRPPAGGVETAHQMLLNAFGPEKGEAMYRKVFPFQGQIPFSFLNELEHNRIELLLKKESPRVVSLVLTYIDPKKASLILEKLDKTTRMEVVKRMARKAEIHPEVIQIMENQFREKIREQGRVVTQEFDGTSALAGILRYMSPDKEETILNELSTGVDPALSDSIRERIFTVQDVLRIPDTAFQEALRDYGDEELAVIIKGKPPMVRDKFLANVSERRRERIREESVYKGSMLKKDVDEATKDFLQYLRSLEESGKLRIPRSEEEYI